MYLLKTYVKYRPNIYLYIGKISFLFRAYKSYYVEKIIYSQFLNRILFLKWPVSGYIEREKWRLYFLFGRMRVFFRRSDLVSICSSRSDPVFLGDCKPENLNPDPKAATLRKKLHLASIYIRGLHAFGNNRHDCMKITKHCSACLFFKIKNRVCQISRKKLALPAKHLFLNDNILFILVNTEWVRWKRKFA